VELRSLFIGNSMVGKRDHLFPEQYPDPFRKTNFMIIIGSAEEEKII
jgi:hypothetical protein